MRHSGFIEEIAAVHYWVVGLDEAVWNKQQAKAGKHGRLTFMTTGIPWFDNMRGANSELR